MLRARRGRPEEPLEQRIPEPILDRPDAADPEHEALLADSVGLALLVVLDALAPPERVAFVLHDMFAVPFGEIAELLDRSPDATRQLASRARRRVRGERVVPDADRLQRAVVDAFLAAARDGDLDALVAVLDPDVVLHADVGAAAAGFREVRGAAQVARQALFFRGIGIEARPALVNGVAGAVGLRDGGRSRSAASSSPIGRIVAIDILADPERLARLDFTAPRRLTLRARRARRGRAPRRRSRSARSRPCRARCRSRARRRPRG